MANGEEDERRKFAWCNKIFNRHQLQHPRQIGNLMDEMALFHPLSEEEWEEYYIGNIRNEHQIHDVAERGFEKVRENLAVIQSITQDDCERYLRKVIFQDTFRGWTARRDSVLALIKSETRLDFDFLRDHPDDWRPRDYHLDFGVFHETAWICIKALPVSFHALAGTLEGSARLDSIRQAHQEFQDHDFGRALLVYYIENEDGSVSLEDQEEVIREILDIAEEFREE